jgi:hypothetical protein
MKRVIPVAWIAFWTCFKEKPISNNGAATGKDGGDGDLILYFDSGGGADWGVLEAEEEVAWPGLCGVEVSEKLFIRNEDTDRDDGGIDGG